MDKTAAESAPNSGGCRIPAGKLIPFFCGS